MRIKSKTQKTQKLIGFFVLPLITLATIGCAEGPLWRTGKYFPWTRSQWAAEEQIAESLFTKRQRMREQVSDALAADRGRQQAVAKELTDVIRNDPIDLVRIEATRQLARLNAKGVVAGLEMAAQDSIAEVRIAAIEGLQAKAPPSSVGLLSRLAQTDENFDVRLAATRALSAYDGNQVLRALKTALDDRDPAMQVAAMESLRQISDQQLGMDVVRWREHMASKLNDTDKAQNRERLVDRSEDDQSSR